MNRPSCVVLCSGGLDSVVLLHHAALDLGMDIKQVLTFNYGAKHNKREAAYAYNQTAKVSQRVKALGWSFSPVLKERCLRLEIPMIGEHFKSSLLKGQEDIPEGHYEDESMRSTVVPFRNGIMLALAAGFAESVKADCIMIANHSGDHAIYPDCRPEFTNAMRRAIETGTYANVSLVNPFINKTKADIVRMGRLLNVDMGLTWSCYKGGELHCGKCGTCIERREAFHLAGVTDPTEYEPDAPTLEELIACNFKYVSKAKTV